MSIENFLNTIYDKSLKGGLVTIGNSCTVVGNLNNTALEYLRPDGSYTLDWHEMGSTSYLDILNNSTIDFALLEWHSTVGNSFINARMKDDYTPITLITPKQSIQITPNSDNEATFTDSDNSIISVKWANVTDIVSNDYVGNYTVCGIPTANTPKLTDHNQSPGWSLTVVYKNNTLPYRQCIINVGIKHQTYSYAPIGRNFNPLQNSKIPTTPLGKSYLTLVASGSSPNRYSGLSLYNKKSNNLVSWKNRIGSYDDAYLLKPNSSYDLPFNNIFSGLIMNTNTESNKFGEIENRGTLGDKNNVPFNINSQLSYKGNRTKLDILCFDISDKINNNDGTLDVSVDLWKPTNYDTFDIIVSSLQIDLESTDSLTPIAYTNSLDEIYTNTLNGGITTIGNTCTIVGSSNDKAKEFIKIDGNYTADWHEIGSTALLSIPENSSIVLAILEWHSTVKNQFNELSDLEKNSSVILNTNQGDFNISLNNSKDLDESYMGTYYKHCVRWSDVTSIIKNTGNGIYAVIGIPTAIPWTLDPLDHNERVGWSLTVVYENFSMPLKQISLSLGINQQAETIPKLQRAIKINGITSSNTPTNSYITLLVGNGNPDNQSILSSYTLSDSNDDLKFSCYLDNTFNIDNISPKSNHLVPYHNIFSGLIKDVNTESASFKNIEINGTLGLKNNIWFDINSKPSFTGNRASLDIMSFDISNKLSENQDELIFLIEQRDLSDILDIYLVSLQIEINSH